MTDGFKASLETICFFIGSYYQRFFTAIFNVLWVTSTPKLFRSECSYAIFRLFYSYYIDDDKISVLERSFSIWLLILSGSLFGRSPRLAANSIPRTLVHYSPAHIELKLVTKLILYKLLFIFIIYNNFLYLYIN